MYGTDKIANLMFKAKAKMVVSPVVFIFLSSVSFIANAGCPVTQEEVQWAQLKSDVDALKEYHQRAKNIDCSDDIGVMVSRAIAEALVGEAETINHDTDNNANRIQALVEQALQYSEHWKAYARLGDLQLKQKQYESAVTMYQDALRTINDEQLTPVAPAQNEIAAVHKKLEQANLLSDTYVPGGALVAKSRGFMVKHVALPITFNFNSDQFTTKGKYAADDLLLFLRDQGSPDITLVGHTDPIGSDDYNLNLSKQRAEAVKNYLLANSYSGRISTQGQGERIPLSIDAPDRYSRDELYRLYRRVELQR